MQPQMDHYARMKFKMYSTVYVNGKGATITGWSTNGDAGEDTTYSYQLNNGGELVQETELTSTAPVAEPSPTPEPTPEPAPEPTPEPAPEAEAAAPEAEAAAPEAAAPEAVAPEAEAQSSSS